MILSPQPPDHAVELHGVSFILIERERDSLLITEVAEPIPDQVQQPLQASNTWISQTLLCRAGHATVVTGIEAYCKTHADRIADDVDKLLQRMRRLSFIHTQLGTVGIKGFHVDGLEPELAEKIVPSRRK